MKIFDISNKEKLSFKAKILAARLAHMIKKNPDKQIFVDQTFLSLITEVSSRQNCRLLGQLHEIFDIKYFNLIYLKGKKNRCGYLINFKMGK